MALQVRSGKNTKFISKLLTIPVLILALVAQPVYVLVASQVASAAAAYSGVIPFTQSEIDANWAKDRSLPSGGYSSVSFAGVSNVLEMKLDKDAANMSGSGFYQTEGLKKQTGSITALKADLYVDGDWIVNNKTVRAGLWGTGKNASNAVSAYPIVEFTTDGYTGWRSYNTVTGAWNNSAAGYNLNAWNTLEITLDSSTDTINYLVNGSTIGTAAANGSTSLAETILNSKNYGSTAQSYDVRWANFSQGTFVPDPVITNVDAYYRVDPTYTAIGVDFKTKNITTATAIELRVNRTNASTYSIHATPSLVAGLNGASDPTSTSGPIVITGSRTSGSWNNQVGTWTGAAAPESVDVIITLAGGETVTLRDTTISENKATWAQVKPVDTTDPAFAITNPVNESYVRGTQTINAEITDESDIAKVLMNIAGSSRSWTNGSSSTITRTGDIFSTTVDTTTIADGPVHVVLRGTDGAGNTRYWNNNANNRQHVFYVDNTRPVVELVSPVGTSYNPVNYEVKATDNLALQTVTAHIYDVTNTTLLKNCSSTVTPDGADEYNLVCPVSSLGLANGTYTIRYNAADKAGNTALTKTATFTIDTTKPTIHVKGQGNAYAPTSLGQGNVFREVSFKLFDGGKVDRVEINGVNKNLTDSTWSDVNNIKPGVAGAVEGKNTLVVFDVAGNSTTYEFVLDTTAPKITIKSSPDTVGSNGVYQKISFKLFDTYKIDYVLINGVKKDLSNDQWSDVNNVVPGAFGAVQGPNTIIACDVAGNCSAPLSFILDTLAPVITTNIIDTYYRGNLTITEYVDEANPKAYHFYVYNADGSIAQIDGANVGAYQANPTTGELSKTIDTKELADGRYYAVFSARDLADNTASLKVWFTIDNTAPVVTFATPTAGQTVRGTTVVSGTVSEDGSGLVDGTFVLHLRKINDVTGNCGAYINTITVPVNADGTWSVNVNTAGLEGKYCITAIAKDNVGNTNGGGNHVKYIIIDNERPVVELITPAGGAVNPTSLTVKAIDNLALNRITANIYDETNTTLIKSCSAFVIGEAVLEDILVCPIESLNLPVGTYTIRYNATDKAGNVAVTKTSQFVIAVIETPAVPTPLVNNPGSTPLSTALLSGNTVALVTTDEQEDVTVETVTPALEIEEEGEVLGAEDTKNEWSLGNAILTGITALLGLIALIGLARRKDDGENNHALVRVLTLVPLAAAVIAFFVIEDLSASMVWFNGWTLLFALVAVVQIVLFFASRRTTESQ